MIGKKKSAASFPSPQHFSPLPSSSVHHSKSKSKSHNERILASPEFGGLDDAHTPVVNRRKNNYNDMDDDKDVGMSSIFDEYNTGAEKELFVPASPEHDFSSFSANNTDNNSTNDDDDLESDPLLAHGAKSFSMPNGRRLSTGLKASSINMKVYRDPIHEVTDWLKWLCCSRGMLLDVICDSMCVRVIRCGATFGL